MVCQCPGSAQFSAAIAVPRIEHSKTTTDAMCFTLILIPSEEVGFAPHQLMDDRTAIGRLLTDKNVSRISALDPLQPSRLTETGHSTAIARDARLLDDLLGA